MSLTEGGGGEPPVRGGLPGPYLPRDEPSTIEARDVRGGLIGIFVQHRTAANLLMALMLVLGAVSLTRMNTQFFPPFGIDVVRVSVAWPGAAAEDVDSNIIQALEPEVRFIDQVKRVNASSLEGVAVIAIEFEAGSDMQKAQADVEQAVFGVTTLPESSERPVVNRITRYDPIARMVLSGPFTEGALKSIAKDLRDELLARGIDKVDLFGARSEKIWVEIAPETLRRLDLTLEDVSRAISATSRDAPAGDVGGGAQQVRTLGERKTADALGDVEVRAFGDGRKILLRDIATVEEGFDDNESTGFRGANPAIELHVRRASTADALEVADIVDAWYAETLPKLAPTLKLERYDVQANLIRDRISMLLGNGAQGLVIVLCVLFLFLNGWIAFWVAMGIPTAMLAGLAVMYATGQTIDMISLFAMIMALGIVVDDAIVVGEHADHRASLGIRPLHAAREGATRMVAPVMSSTLTTVAAFMPLFLIQGIIGEIVVAIPLVIISVLIASLIESFLVLPSHMRHALRHKHKTGDSRFRVWFDRGFNSFRDGAFRAFVAMAIRWRYATIAVALGAFIVSIGMVVGGRVGFTFFPTPEADVVFANVELAAGSSREDVRAALDLVEQGLDDAIAGFGAEGEGVLEMVFKKIGTAVGEEGPGGFTTSDTVGGIQVQLRTADERKVRLNELIDAWNAAIPPLPRLRTLSIASARGGPPGKDVDVRLYGLDLLALKAAADEVRLLLERYPGVTAIDDDLPFGKPETLVSVTERGRALGLDNTSVGAQLRAAFEGDIARKFARGDEEVEVVVRYPREATRRDALDELWLRTPSGAQIPLLDAVETSEKVGFSRIKRDGGLRGVAVQGELDTAIATTGDIVAALERDGLAAIAEKYNLSYEFRGKAEEQAETFGDMGVGAGIGFFAIYIILAWVFGSYARPIVVMLAIPLGFIGVVFGHFLLGYSITFLSMVALLGLSGVVINDFSIVLITTIDERMETEPPYDAIVSGSCDRLRAVILTSATTIGGLAPLIFETSIQAQFLIPMAITFCFGLGVATMLVLIVNPAMVAIQVDIARVYQRMTRRDAGAGLPAAAE